MCGGADIVSHLRFCHVERRAGWSQSGPLHDPGHTLHSTVTCR